MDRQRVQWVEIDVPWCDHVWGTAPCAAALGGIYERKCFQTFGTCGDPDNFSPGVRTITLFPNVAGIPVMQGIFPVLQSLKESEATVNISGSDSSLSAFGKRGTFEAKCSDPKDSDRYFDKYHAERISGAAQLDAIGYVPGDLGTLFRRLKARWPHYAGRNARCCDGWLEDGVLTTDETRYFILTDFETDTQSSAVFKGRDILDVAGNDRALCPKPSNGKLTLDISDVDTSITLTPTGIGDDEYSASGVGCIGSEIVTFTRSGDVVTLTARGTEGTTAASHNALDTFQQAAVFNDRADLVLNDILTNYAPVPTSYIPLSEWEDEMLLGSPSLVLKATLPKPELVSKLVPEIAMLGLSVFLKDGGSSIGLRTNRPVALSDVTWEITDDDLLPGGITAKAKDDARLTEVLFESVQIDPTKGTSDGNFQRGQYTVDGDAKNPNAYGDSRLKVAKVRWINQGDDVRMRAITLRYLARFVTAPRIVEAVVRKSKYGAAGLTDIAYVTTNQETDTIGRAVRQAYQIIGKKRESTSTVRLTLQRFAQTKRYIRFMPAATSTPLYDDATAYERANGFYFVAAANPKFSDGSGPYYFT